MWLAFAVFPKAAVLFKPDKGMLDDPAFLNHGEGVQFA
jgi:hypothetical protein